MVMERRAVTLPQRTPCLCRTVSLGDVAEELLHQLVAQVVTRMKGSACSTLTRAAPAPPQVPGSHRPGR